MPTGITPTYREETRGEGLGPLYEAPSILSRVLPETFMPWNSSPSLFAIVSLPSLPFDAKFTIVLGIPAVEVPFLARRHGRQHLMRRRNSRPGDREPDCRAFPANSCTFQPRSPHGCVFLLISTTCEMFEQGQSQIVTRRGGIGTRKEKKSWQKGLTGERTFRIVALPFGRNAPRYTQVERLDSYGGLS